MPTTYTVAQGDCLSSIAHDYGFGDWRTIYNDPNNAGFRNKRPNPSVIYPGDELYIPDFVPRDEGCRTDMNHQFQLIAPPTFLNLRIQDPSGNALSGIEYLLIIEGSDAKSRKLVFRGKTDGDGWIKRKIHASSRSGSLQVWPNPADREVFFKWQVQLGCLDPLESISGVKARLNNLGYTCGDTDSTESDLYNQMVRQFQRDHGLEEDGIMGPQTRDKLNQEHRV
jgi:hypothetical protein